MVISSNKYHKLFLIIGLFFQMDLFCQESSDKMALYLSSSVIIGPINNQTGIFAGFESGFRIDSIMEFGLAAFSQINQVKTDEIIKQIENDRIQRTFFVLFGGPVFRYVFLNNQKNKLVVDLLVGPLLLILRDDKDKWKDNSEGLLTLQPRLTYHVRFGENISLIFGGGYMFCSNFTSPFINRNELQNYFLNAGVSFGK
jgi:hypothetical protein